MKKAVGIVVSIVVCELAGIIGSFFTTPSIPGWYAGLAKPAFNPPAWVFAPVWFRRISKAAAWLLVPYILWVSFATVLTVSIFALNR